MALPEFADPVVEKGVNALLDAIIVLQDAGAELKSTLTGEKPLRVGLDDGSTPTLLQALIDEIAAVRDSS